MAISFIKMCSIFFPRTLLAVLHFNENTRRAQATSKQGNPLYAVKFPKARKGECRAVRVLVDPTYSKFPFPKKKGI